MSFFSKKTTLLAFLNNGNLKLAQYNLGARGVSSIGSDTLTFADGVVKDSSVANSEGFLKEVSDFFNARPELKKSSVIFVIPEEKTFIKGFSLELGDLERKEEFRATFLSEVPFLEEELIVKERLDGRMLEFTAVSKKYLEDLQYPFANLGLKIEGVISVSQALARHASPGERSTVLTFYDNDFVLALVQNSSVLFSETERMTGKDTSKQFVSALKHFSKHPDAKNVKTAVLILDPELPEGVMKERLEEVGFKVTSVEKISLLDLLVEYYNSRPKSKWDLLFTKKKGLKGMLKGDGKYLRYAGIGFLILVIVGVWAFLFFKYLFPREPEPVIIAPTVVEVEVEVATTTPEATSTPELPAEEPLGPLNKANFPIQIFNGTFVSGEASRLGSILQEAGFTVAKVDNYENQTQAKTTLFVSEGTRDDLVNELRAILEIYYQEVVISITPVETEDIHIVIGAKK